MEAKRINVSVSKEMSDFLEENPQISPSKLLQQAISALMTTYNRGDLTALLQEERRKANAIKLKFEEMRDFLEKKGLVEDFFFNNENENKRSNTLKR